MLRYHLACVQEPFPEEERKTQLMTCLDSLATMSHMFSEGIPSLKLAVQPFQFRLKAHAMEHLALDQLDETYMNCMKRLSRGSTHPKTLKSAVLLKLALDNGITCFRGD
eukprot:NODE_4309_length_687_cov_1.313291.p2 GENE.NODE_4309_length_687_cov_1.313291~~NODE_4309_length_687_cov_1.313291.p2  ORF type:complete len:109 (+),score=21.28 NODE_4309_length_687_cov_1.313291:1-327(+)